MQTETKVLITHRLAIALTTMATLVGVAAAESGQSKALPPLPQKVVTTDGKTYDSVRLLRAEPDGLVIEYAPAGRGVGMAKVRFQNLPDNLQQQYGYDADRAKAFEADQAQAMAQWRAQRLEQENAARQAAKQEMEESQQAQPAPAPAILDSGRFQVAPTISGAVILDKQTGEAWIADLHSTISPQTIPGRYYVGYDNLIPFVQRKDAK